MLITGGAGYIGSHTVVELAQAGHSTAIVDKQFEERDKLCPFSKSIGLLACLADIHANPEETETCNRAEA
ncbi:MAG: NAD-dependent epimerase/dehydratase family protein [Ruminococcaceae bacterium]|nr:NAD-dependent epimerase/dehydratase family protein [Oscillospiraceae bacterium]